MTRSKNIVHLRVDVMGHADGIWFKQELGI